MGSTRSSGLAFAAAFAALVVGVFLALGGAAYAQSNPSSADDQYKDKIKVVNIKVDKSQSVTETQADVESQVGVESAGQTLPNTGLSLLVTALVGGALVAVGMGLRRRERKQ